MNQSFKRYYLFVLFFCIYSLPEQVSAQINQWDLEHPLIKGFRYFLDSLIVLVFALALVFFFWGLAIFIANAGNEEKRSEGKKRMLWGIIALTVMVGIWGIVNFILVAFGIDQSSAIIDVPDFPTKLP